MKSKMILFVCFLMFFAMQAYAGVESYLEEVTADEPVLWHPFDYYDANINGFASRIPYGGNVAYAINGTATSEDSVLDSSYVLSGSNYGLAAGAPDPAVFTLEVWAKAFDASGWSGALLSYRGGAAGYILYLHDVNQMDVHVGTGALYVGTVTVDQPESWHQYVLTFDNAYANDPNTASTAMFYVDGQLELTQTGNLSRSDGVGGVNIGNDISCALPQYCSNYFTGFIDEYSVYDSVLSEERILAHYVAATTPDSFVDDPEEGLISPIVKLLFNDGQANSTPNNGTLGGTQYLPLLNGQKVAGIQPPVNFDSGTYWQQAGYDPTAKYSDYSIPELSDMTLAFWVVPAILDSSWRNILSSRDDSGSVLNVFWSLNSDGVHGDIHVDNGSQRITAYGVLSYNTWTHIAVSFDPEGVKLYIDGNLADVSGFWNSPVAASTLGLSIANPSVSGTLYGGIDNVFMYDVALSQAQVEVLMLTNKAPISTCHFINGYSIALAGDLNSDCRVDISDLIELLNEWLLCLDPISESCN